MRRKIAISHALKEKNVTFFLYNRLICNRLRFSQDVANITKNSQNIPFRYFGNFWFSSGICEVSKLDKWLQKVTLFAARISHFITFRSSRWLRENFGILRGWLAMVKVTKGYIGLHFLSQEYPVLSHFAPSGGCENASRCCECPTRDETGATSLYRECLVLPIMIFLRAYLASIYVKWRAGVC